MKAKETDPSGGSPDRGLRRLPVYALLDISGSMAGRPLEIALKGILRLAAYLIEQDAPTHTPIALGLIGFHTSAFPLLPLTGVSALAGTSLGLECLEAGGSSSFGAALEVLDASIEHELTSPGTAAGDEQPLVYIFTDGQMTDDWSYRKEVLRRTTALICSATGGALKPEGGFRREALDVIKQFLPVDAWDDMRLFVDGALDRMREVPPRTIPWPTTY